MLIRSEGIDRGRRGDRTGRGDGGDGEISLSSRCCVLSLTLRGNLPALVDFVSAASDCE